MYSARLLPADEWHRLAATDFPNILPYVGSSDLDVMVVEDEGQIIGCWGLMPMLHLEGLWIDPAYRGKSSVARRLLTATWQEVKRRAPRWVMTGASDEKTRSLLTRQMGAVPVLMDTYLISMTGEKRCHSLL